MDFGEVDGKKAWQTVGLLVANNFTGEHQGRLVHTQLSAPAFRTGSLHTTRAKLFLETRPKGQTHSMNLLFGAAKRPASVHVSILLLKLA